MMQHDGGRKFAGKLLQIQTTLRALRYMGNPRSEYLILKFCSVHNGHDMLPW